MRKIGLIVSMLLIFTLLNGCISNERIFQINVKSSHTWTIYLDVNVKVWKNYSKINEEPDYSYSEDKVLYVNGIKVFDIILNFDEIGYIEIKVNASTIDGYYDEYVLTSFDLEEDYYFDIIGSGNEVKVIKSN